MEKLFSNFYIPFQKEKVILQVKYSKDKLIERMIKGKQKLNWDITIWDKKLNIKTAQNLIFLLKYQTSFF